MNEEATYQALVVDDNWYNRNLSALALTRVGYQVTEAQDGLEALTLLEKHTFDLLILDLVMPDIDGAMVLQQIRRQALHRRMRVVVMTANPHMTAEEIGDDADYVMYKPIDVVQFAEFVNRIKGNPFRCDHAIRD